MHRPRPLATGVLAVLAFALPAAAAHAGTAVVQVDRAHHVMRTVDTRTHQVGSVHVRGRLPRTVTPGSLVSFRRTRGTVRGVRRVGRLRTPLAVPGTVVRADATGTTVALADGRPLTIGLTVNGLQEGQSVELLLRFGADGSLAVTITITGAAPQEEDDPDPVAEDDDDQGDDDDAPAAADCRQDGVRGRVVGVNRVKGVVSIARTWGDEETYAAAPALLSGVADGTVVLVHLAATGAADKITPLPNADLRELDGTVVRISDEAEQITVDPRDGTPRLTFDAPCWVRSSVFRAEDVHLVAHRDASGDLVVDAVDANDGSAL